MFGTLPKQTKNLASNLVENAKKFGERVPKDLKEFGERVPKDLGDYSSGLVDAIKDLANTRLIYDGCNAGIRVGSGGLFKIYRNKYCNPSPQPEIPQPPNNNYSLQVPLTPVNCGSLPPLIITYRKYLHLKYYRHETEIKVTITEVEYPKYYPFTLSNGATANALGARVTFNVKFYIEGDGDIHTQDEDYIYDIWELANRPEGSYQYASYNPPSMQYTLFGFNGQDNYLGVATYNQDRAIYAFGWRSIYTHYLEYPEYDYDGIPTGNIAISHDFQKTDSFCGNYKKVPKIPPPPPPPKKCCMSNCCPDNSNIEALLKLIIKRIGEPQKVTIFDEDLDRKGSQKADKTPESLNEYLKLAVDRIEIANRIMGIESFPVTVPDTMIEPFKEGIFAKVFKFIDGEKKRKINSITEFIAWMAEQDSAVLGEFHQVIEYQTDDKKSANIVLPNVAEALKEIVLLTSQMAKQNNVQTELIFKIAAEVVAARAAATRAGRIAEDIQDYLDYPTQTKTANIPTSVTLPKVTANKEGKLVATSETENHKNFLKPGEIKFTYDDWTGNHSLHDQLLDLLQLAAMLRAIYYQRTDNG